MSNINDTYFDGYYKDIWRTIIPEELTAKELAFMIPYFKLEQGCSVLDLMCGYGRHAIALSKKGIHVTAIDNLADYVNEINNIAGKDQLPLKAIKEDILNFKLEEVFDLAICMGNSLNFFNAADTIKLLKTISAHLKTGGQLLINSWSIAEITFKNFRERSWSTIGDLKFLTDSQLLFHPTRVESESTIIAPDGHMEVKKGIDYIFSINELEAMINKAGLVLQEVYSIPGRKKFTVGEPRAYLVAGKV